MNFINRIKVKNRNEWKCFTIKASAQGLDLVTGLLKSAIWKLDSLREWALNFCCNKMSCSDKLRCL